MATKFLGMKTSRKLYIIIVKYMIFFFSSPASKCDESWKVYDESQLAVINIIVNEEDLEWMYQNVDSDSIHMASIHFENAYINDQIDSVGFRLRGNTSRNAEKKSFKVDFDHYISGREFYDVEKLNLNGEHNDPSIKPQAHSDYVYDYINTYGRNVDVMIEAKHKELAVMKYLNIHKMAI